MNATKGTSARSKFSGSTAADCSHSWQGLPHTAPVPDVGRPDPPLILGPRGTDSNTLRAFERQNTPCYLP